MIRSTLLATAAVFSMTAAVNAGTVVIDDFNNTNFQVVGAPTLGNPAFNPATTSGPTTDAIGGVRTITNTRTAPGGTANAFGQQVQSTVTGGIASVSLGANTQGFSVFSWSGGGADLTDGGLNDRIVIEVLTTDLAGVTFTLDVDGAAVTRTATAAGTLSFAFSDFGGADLTSANAISLLVAGPESFDATFDFVAAVGQVPVPAAGLLALGGIGALGAVRARRKS